MRRFWGLLLFCCYSSLWAADANKVLNLFIWADEVPSSVIQQFSRETGIQVNYTTYDSNEELYTKLKAAGNQGYDVIEPTSYYLERMRREKMLLKLDKQKFSHYQNIDPYFLNHSFDPNSDYGIPYVFTTTGIFYNTRYFATQPVSKWSELWQSRFNNKLLMLNDPRDTFFITLLSLGYSGNSIEQPQIEQAYNKLVTLLPNVKLFNDQAVVSIAVDEDATIGVMWGGDFMRARRDNAALKLIFPDEGFPISVDCFAILKDAPHVENAYKFLDFMMRAEIAKQGTLVEGYPVANLAARKQLPAAFAKDTILYPPPEVMRRGIFESDIGDDALALYTQYWQMLKMKG